MSVAKLYGTLRWGGAIMTGIAVGAFSALTMAGLIPGVGGLASNTISLDGWNTDFTVGSTAADPYTRAWVARHGLLALARSEAIYFTRNTDNQGRRLREECRYRLSGGSLPAQWWSVTLYDANSRLPMNADDALSLDANRAGKGTWSAMIAPDAPDAPDEEAWISSRNAGEFDLTLRLYVPASGLIDDPVRLLVPPRIERLQCRGDSV